jgi:ubiquinone/menaquinone biosynthesis C-methylase UbiE
VSESEPNGSNLAPDILAHYAAGIERDRLVAASGQLEFVRTQELLQRFLPRPPATLLDVGGGPGQYAAWLARLGYAVHLVDPVQLHVEQARARAAAQPDHPFTADTGDARALALGADAYDAALLLGPLYHLTERTDRLRALQEARRVVKPGGRVFVAGISRFASLLDGMRGGMLTDPTFAAIVARDLQEGQHRNPDPVGRLEWFTTAYFHHPAELANEIAEAGLTFEAVLGIEGPSWLFPERWDDPAQQASLLDAARAVEREATLVGLSAHLLAISTV